MSDTGFPGNGADAVKVAGVIGGMGPQATADFLARIIRATPARDDCDHIRVLIDNNPKVPSRIARILEGSGEDPLPVLIAMARGLAAQGADFLTIPCNTAHFYLPDIARAVGIPILDMVALAVERLGALRPRPRRIGMLAMPAVRKVGLYEARLAAAGMAALFPDPAGEAAVLGVIRAVKARAVTDAHRAEYAAVASALARSGADALLIACTELSVLGAPHPGGGPAVDALDALVEATIGAARGSR
jgi:aspartate racemase